MADTDIRRGSKKSILDAKLQQLKEGVDILLLVYPVGAVYLAEVNTPPGTLFGGTWESMTPPTGISYVWKRTA